MIESYKSFIQLYQNNFVEPLNKQFCKLLENYSFYFISDIAVFDQNTIIKERFKESNVSLIDILIDNCSTYFVVGFKKILIIIPQKNIIILQSFFSQNACNKLYFLSNS